MTPQHDAPVPARSRVRDLVGVVFGGAFMGAAEIVPGVSGGTIALVFGIYDEFIAALSAGSAAIGVALRGDLRGGVRRLRDLDWGFLVALGVGMGSAILALTRGLEHLLAAQPVVMSALFFGLVAGSVWLARRELRHPLDRSGMVALVVMALVTFVVLGVTSGRVAEPSLLAFFGAAAIAICAMVLPGISGSFLLLLLGMYPFVISAVNDRDLVVVVVFGLGAVVGLALFSSLLHLVLERRHDLTLAVLIGLMVGSLRVLWPWPTGVEGVGDARLGAPVVAEVPAAVLAGLAGIVIVIVIARIGDATVGSDQGDEE